MNPLIEAASATCETLKVAEYDVLRVRDDMFGNCGTNADDGEYAFYKEDYDTPRSWPRAFYWRLVVDQEVLHEEPLNITGDQYAPGGDWDGYEYDWNLNRVPPPNSEDVVSQNGKQDNCHYRQLDSQDNWSLVNNPKEIQYYIAMNVGYYHAEFHGGQCASPENIANTCANLYADEVENRDDTTTLPPGWPDDPEPIPDVYACSEYDFFIGGDDLLGSISYQNVVLDTLMIPVKFVGHAVVLGILTPLWVTDITTDTFPSQDYRLKGITSNNDFIPLKYEPTTEYLTLSNIPLNYHNGDYRTVSFDIIANHHPETPSCNGDHDCMNLWDPIRLRYIHECGQAEEHPHPDRHGRDYWPKCTMQFDVGNPVYKDYSQ